MFKTFAVACITSFNLAKECAFPPNEHFVESLPYFNQEQELPCMYAGTLPSNAELTHNLFYWMYTNGDA